MSRGKLIGVGLGPGDPDLMTLRTARLVAAEEPDAQALYKRLMRHRFWTHVIGMISIFVSAVFGMYHNLSVVPGFAKQVSIPAASAV